MVHQLAKILIILSLSFFLAAMLSVVIFLIMGKLINEYIGGSWLGTFAYLNAFFGWFIYAIPLAIIGFKIYPEPKKKTSK